jgi:hypothetical protein
MRVEATRVEAMRVEATRVEAMRVEATRVEAMRVEAMLRLYGMALGLSLPRENRQLIAARCYRLTHIDSYYITTPLPSYLYGVCLGDPTLMEASYMQITFITHLLFAEQSRKLSGIRLVVAFFCVGPDGSGRILSLIS